MTRIHPTKAKTIKSRRGAAAIEFAFVVLPFFALLLGILEIGILLLVNAMVDTAASDTSRLIRTGQAQIGDLKPAEVRQRFCAKMAVFGQDCTSRTHVDIRVVEGFTSNTIPDPMATGTFNPDIMTYQPGLPGDFILVRIWFEHPIVTPLISRAVTRDSTNKVRLQSTLAFRNEPYL